MIRLTFILGAIALFLDAPPTSAQAGKSQSSGKSGNPLVTALWFSHLYAMPQERPRAGTGSKVALITGLRGKPSELFWSSVRDVFDKSTFQKIAGDDNNINLEKMDRIVHERNPPSRDDLISKVRQHADLLSTQFDLIAEAQRQTAEPVVAWICRNYHAEEPLAIIVICTGNSRRSMLGSTMGNIAADYYGLRKLRFYSGGTTPSAFNPRAIASLKAIGVEIEATGREAPRGESFEVNPIYRVRWGKGLEALEFSKLYSDAHNPQKGFAAILVCSEADASCPEVKGASARISLPYMDPKVYDGAPFEAAKYAERRDDMGRFMLNVVMQARRRLELNRK